MGGTSREAVGQTLRQWRRRRRLSRLELASLTGVSTRHLSCLEAGKANASRQLLLYLADELDVPLRDRNELLLAAGHEPYPAVVMDRRWNVIERNGSAA